MVRTKVFVGNLSFKTTEAELSEHFKASGTVVGANIITRGPRSLGYGFVELESEEDANNAVKLMNKKEIDGRQINVEVAKPREEEESGEKTNNNNNTQQSPRGRGGRGGSRGAMRGANPMRGVASRGRGVPRRRFRPRNLEGTEQTDESQSPQTQPAQGSPQQSHSPRGGRGGMRGRGRGGRGRGGRVARPPIEERANTPSKTSLFVANLPFSLDDEGFGKVFSDSGLQYKSAYVVRKRNGHSKGFGFVEFDNEEDQQKALQLNNKQIGAPGSERELIIKIALTETKDREVQGEDKEVKTEQKTEPKKPVEEKKPQPVEQKKTTPQEPKKVVEPKKTPEKKEEPKKVDSPKQTPGAQKKEEPKK